MSGYGWLEGMIKIRNVGLTFKGFDECTGMDDCAGLQTVDMQVNVSYLQNYYPFVELSNMEYL
jgi:hypothetical protein